MRYSISEVLEKTTELHGFENKKTFLHQNNSSAIQTILKYALDKNIKWLLPEGEPPYKKNEMPDAHGMLYTQARKLYLFIEGGNPNLTRVKRESLFIELLESLDQKDAELIIAVKDKKIPYRGFTTKFVNKVFPGLIIVGEEEEIDGQDVQET